MKSMLSLGLRFDGAHLLVLDQRLLPGRVEWVACHSPEEMAELIRGLAVRGAPLIGVAAALSLAHAAERGASVEKLGAFAATLRSARPTAVNLMAAVDRVVVAGPEAASMVREAEAIFDEDVRLCEALATHGASLITYGEGILTHCNTGGLATAGAGTALAVIARAHEQGKRIHVYVDETRPLLQGGRLTTWELDRLGIPHTLICDNMAAILMRAGKVQRVLTGADRIAVNGDFANKVGTYGVAVLARHHGVPFHPIAPFTTVDVDCLSGDAIPIEQRDPGEVRGSWTQNSCAVFNPAFDMTPVSLVESLVLDCGVYDRDSLLSGCLTRIKR